MEKFYQKESFKTPEIKGDIKSGEITIVGRCMPEDGSLFFAPFTEWLTKYLFYAPETTKVQIFLDYFNTTASKPLLSILRYFKDMLHEKELELYWFHEEDDLEMRDCGKDFQNILGDFIKIVSVPDKDSLQF